MRKIFDAFLFIIVVFTAAFVYLYHDELVSKTRKVIYGAACSKPITYSIGFIDPRFNLTDEAVANFIKTAAEAWDKASGKNLIDHVEEGGDVIVNFQYDRRQEVTVQLEALSSQIDIEDDKYKELKARYNSLLVKLEQDKQSFEAHKIQVTKMQMEYNQEVRGWNRGGGAPKDIHDNLNQKKLIINQEYEKLNQEAAALNEAVKQINDLVRELNASASAQNSTINQYNNLGDTLEPEFKEGEYISDGKNKRIEIYQFNDSTKLIRVLQHEFGHAIGLDHVEDSGAIMHALNSGTSLAPNLYDLAELQRACEKL